MVDATKFHCKCCFGVVRMLVRILRDLNLYLIVDQKQMKVIDANQDKLVEQGLEWDIGHREIMCRNTKSMP